MVKQETMRTKGFTLVEIAIVLVIIGLITVGSFSMVKQMRVNASLKASDQKIQQIKKMLLNFVQVNGYLPCADGNLDGKEDRATSGNEACTTAVGNLPYQDLGMSLAGAKDAYGNLIRYAINTDTLNDSAICDSTKSASYFCKKVPNSFNLSTPPTASLSSTGDYVVCRHVANCTAASDIDIASATVVLVAFNRFKGKSYTTTSKTNAAAPGCTGLASLESENCDTDHQYVNAPFDDTLSSFFDDNVDAITGYEVKQKINLLSSLATGGGTAGGSSGSGTGAGNGGASNGGGTSGAGGTGGGNGSSLASSIQPQAPDIPQLPSTTNATNQGDAPPGYQKLMGTPQSDNLIAGNNWNDVDLMASDDQLKIGNAGGGYSTLDAGSGSDIVQAGDGWNAVKTSDGNNQFTIGDGSDIITFGSGDDRLKVGNANNQTYAKIQMGSGNDSVIAGDGWNEINLSDGTDKLQAGNGIEVLKLGSGTKDVTVGDAGAGYSTLSAGSGTRTVVMGNHWNKIDISSGTSKIKAGDGLETVKLASGDDILVIGDAGAGYSKVETGDGADQVVVGKNFDEIKLGDGNDSLVAGSVPAAGYRKIDAGSGDDVLKIAQGFDEVVGGSGNDTVIFQGQSSDWTHTTVNGKEAYKHNATGLITVLKEVENVSFGG